MHIDTSDELWQASFDLTHGRIRLMCTFDRFEVYKVQVCQSDTWQMHHNGFFLFVSSKAEVNSRGEK